MRGDARADAPWWTQVVEAVASEPLAAAVVVAAALPLVIAAALVARVRRRGRR